MLSRVLAFVFPIVLLGGLFVAMSSTSLGGSVPEFAVMAKTTTISCTSETPPTGPALVDLYPTSWSALEQTGRSGRADATTRQLRAAAQGVLDQGPWTVTKSPRLAPGGDPHQYVTLSRYWWPSKSSKDGVPYVRRDGQTDPLVKHYPDETYLDDTIETVDTLARAYSVSHDEQFASRAALLLQVFFLDPTTAVAPDFTWGQFVPGQTHPRGDGILDSRVLINLPDDLTLLQGSKAWTSGDESAMVSWLSQLQRWLVTSAVGKEAAAEPNNHGTWYDAETAAISTFIGAKSEATAIIGHYVSAKLGHQVEPDGQQPLELARTNSWTYSTFNLEAGLLLASDARLLGYDLFSCRARSGASLEAALDYLLPYATGSRHWNHKQISGFDASAAALPVWMAATWFDDAAAVTALAKIRPGPSGAASGSDPLDLATVGSST